VNDSGLVEGCGSHVRKSGHGAPLLLLVLRRAVGLPPDAHPNDDEAVVRMGHPDWWRFGGMGLELVTAGAVDAAAVFAEQGEEVLQGYAFVVGVPDYGEAE